MRYERVEAPPEMDGCEGLLALIVYRNDEARTGHSKPLPDRGTTFLTDPGQPLQLAHMGFAPGHVVPAHVHLPRPRGIAVTQEALLISRGRVVVRFFTSEGVLVTQRTLYGGDVVLMVGGGHELMTETAAEVVEVKQGPYFGKELDKRGL